MLPNEHLQQIVRQHWLEEVRAPLRTIVEQVEGLLTSLFLRTLSPETALERLYTKLERDRNALALMSLGGALYNARLFGPIPNSPDGLRRHEPVIRFNASQAFEIETFDTPAFAFVFTPGDDECISIEFTCSGLPLPELEPKSFTLLILIQEHEENA